MHRTEGTNHAANLFANGPPGTVVEQEWLNAVQEEIANVIEQCGVTLKTSATESRDQLWDALLQGGIRFVAGTIMLFGQSAAPTGWTRKSDWQNNAMLCYAASGAIASGGADNPQSWVTAVTIDNHTALVMANHTALALSNHSNHAALSLNTEAAHTHPTADFTLLTTHMPAHSHRLWSTDSCAAGSAYGFGCTSGGVSDVISCHNDAGTAAWYSTLFASSHAVMENTGGGTAHNHGGTSAGSAHGHSFSQNINAHSAHSFSQNISAHSFSQNISAHSVNQDTFSPYYQEVIAATKD